MPTLDELLDKLYGAQYFYKLDLKSGYHQILMRPEDRMKITFRTQPLVMPLGMSNAPNNFLELHE